MPDAARFDALIHAPQRLRICAIASAATHVEFGELQRRLEISKSALSKQLTQLVDAGYLNEERITRGGRPRVRLSMTDVGRHAYLAHLAALREIINAPAISAEHAEAGAGVSSSAG